MLHIHPATVLRFHGGTPALHNSALSGPDVPLPDAGTIALIASFAVPRDKEDLLQRVPPAMQPRLSALVDTLTQRGMLRAASSPHAATATPLTEAFAAMTTALHQLAGEAASLPIEQQQSWANDIESLLAGFSNLQQQIRTAHDQQLAGALSRFSPPESGWQLHLGAGAQRIDGWLGVDARSDAECPMNLSSGLPFADASAGRIFAAHVLEHLYYPNEAQALLRECRRVLRPGGRIRLIVPDIGQCLHAYANDDHDFFAQRRTHWPHWPQGRTPLEDFLSYAGAGPDPAQTLDSHKFGYDLATLEATLKRADFREITHLSWMSGPDPDILLDTHSFAAGAEHGQGHYSLFVEAIA